MTQLTSFKRWLRRIFPDPKRKTNEELLDVNDVFLASYPRSGNTWCRTILAHLLYPDFQLERMSEIRQFIPAVHRPIPHHQNYSRPRIIKTHQPFHYRLGKNRDQLYKKNIYIVRNVFDVIKSYYHYKEARGKLVGVDWNAFALRMAYGMYGPGLWQEHVLGWYAAGKYHGEVLFVKYEDLMAQPTEEVARMAHFLGQTKSEKAYQQIVEKSNIHNMKRAQEEGAISAVPDFIRSGEKRLPQLIFEKKTIELIIQNNQAALTLLGYPHPEFS
ncbi:MAG: sulfotransferase domain-containing protein [Bacteroidota bacterium]